MTTAQENTTEETETHGVLLSDAAASKAKGFASRSLSRRLSLSA